MPSLEEIREQIRGLGWADTFGTKKEIKSLPEILSGDETVLGLTSGLMDGKTWLVVLTHKRVIFLDKGMIYGLKRAETPLNKINSIESKTGLIFGQIAIWDGAAKSTIKNVAKGSIGPFVKALNKAMDDLKPSGGEAQSGDNDLAGQLAKLAGLKDSGVLTEEEFQRAKERLIGGGD